MVSEHGASGNGGKHAFYESYVPPLGVASATIYCIGVED
jgi:hypothetical protein